MTSVRAKCSDGLLSVKGVNTLHLMLHARKAHWQTPVTEAPLLTERSPLCSDPGTSRVRRPTDLGAQHRRYLVAMALPPARPVASADDDVRAQMVQHQQRADEVHVEGALSRQPGVFAERAARVFVLGLICIALLMSVGSVKAQETVYLKRFGFVMGE